jgi:hypothetical protein
MIDEIKVDHEAARRAVFYAGEIDAHSRRAWERTASEPKVASRLSAISASMEAHRRAYNRAESLGVPEGKRLPLQAEETATKRLPGEIVFDGKRMVRIGDADDHTPLASFYPAREIAERNRLNQAEHDYVEHAEAETGMSASPEEVSRQRLERAEIRRQSHEIARLMGLAGKEAYRDDSVSLWAYYIHSRTWENIPNFRRICLLPYVAAMVRASKLAALEYFLERHPFARFWTFTSGPRVGLDDLKERHQWLTDRLNKLNKMLRHRYGVEIVFRSEEFGTVEFDERLNRVGDSGAIEFDDKGNPLFHLHAHCVVVSQVGYIKPAKWDEMIRAVWDFWGYHWDAGKIIRDARECCKYVTKPGDMLKLSPEQLGRLHEAVYRQKLCQPLGSLAEEIRNRKAAGKTLRRYRTREGSVWREVFDQNKLAEIDEEDRWKAEDLRDARRMASETAAAARAKPGEVPAYRDDKSPWCRVYARLSPSVGPRGLKEPRVICGGTMRDEKIDAHPLVSRLWAQTVAAWEAGLRISVHTGTPTGREAEPFGFLPDLPERVEPPAEPVWAGN